MRLIDFLGALVRRWLIVLGCFFLCAGVAYGYSKISPKVYRATTLLSVTPARFDYGNGLATQQLIANYAQQMTGQDLFTQLNNKLQLDMSPAQLAAEVKTTPDNNTLTITIDVDDQDAQRATDIANNLAQLFVTTIQQINQAQLNPDVNVSILHSAVTPSNPNRPNTKVNTAAGGILGLVLGAALVYALELWDDRLRTPHDVEVALGLSLLGSVPQFRAMASPNGALSGGRRPLRSLPGEPALPPEKSGEPAEAPEES